MTSIAIALLFAAPHPCDNAKAYESLGDVLVSARDLCFSRAGEDALDVELCKRAGTQADGCIGRVAAKKPEPALCEQASSRGRNDCYRQVARATHGAAPCEHVTERRKPALRMR